MSKITRKTKKGATARKNQRGIGFYDETDII